MAFVAGAWWLQQQATLFESRTLLAWTIGLCALAGLAAYARAYKRSSTRVHRRAARSADAVARRASIVRSASEGFVVLGVAVAATMTGFTWASWRADLRLADTLPHDLENRDLVVIGTVAVLPAVEPRGTRFEFAVEEVVSRDAHGVRLAVPAHLALGWYRPGREGASGAAIPDLRPGQRWRLTVRLKRPHGSANPFGFDYEYWLLEEGLRATGYVRPGIDADEGDEADDTATDHPPPAATSTRKLSEFVWTIDHAIERTRDRLRARVLTVLADGGDIRVNAPYAGVIVALIVGDQRAIAQSDWIVFNRTGIGHLVSISGLHVSMLAALGAWLVFRLWRWHPALCARLPAHKAAALAGTSVALLYCLLAGWGVPAQRTLYMIGVVAFALWLHRLNSVSRVLCTALVIVVVLDPWAVTGSGFWLSFAAVASIFYVSAGRVAFAPDSSSRWARLVHALRGAARVQWAVTLALTPLTLLFFYQASIVSPIANAIAIPLVSFVVTPLALTGAVLPGTVGAWLLHGAHGLVALLALFLQWLSASPIAVWSGAAPSAWAFACATIGVVWWLAPRGLRGRWTGALWMMPLFVAPLDRPAEGSARLTALDIGQGTSVLVETATTNVLYDTGPDDGGADGAGNDAGGRIIVPLLHARGIERLDTMVVSHNDNDHSGGALSILASLPVDEVRSSLAFDSPIVRSAAHHDRCIGGQSWTSDGVRFDLLAPSPEVYRMHEGKPVQKPNAHSCVLRVEAAGHVMLLTADIEKRDEGALVERMPARIASDVLLVPHHGSRTSSTDAFIDAVHPGLAIVQAGYLNRFAHPRPDVLARYEARAIPVLRNDRDGAITVTMTGGRVLVERYRDTHRRYWYGR